MKKAIVSLIFASFLVFTVLGGVSAYYSNPYYDTYYSDPAVYNYGNTYEYESPNFGYQYSPNYGAGIDVSLHDYAYGDGCYEGYYCGDRTYVYTNDYYNHGDDYYQGNARYTGFGRTYNGYENDYGYDYGYDNQYYGDSYYYDGYDYYRWNDNYYYRSDDHDHKNRFTRQQLVRALAYTMRDATYFRNLKYGQPTVDVYSDYTAQNEDVPASNFRNKEVYDPVDYPQPSYAEPVYNRMHGVNNAGKAWDYKYNAYSGGRVETAQTPYYYEPVYDENLGYYNWRY